MPLLAPHGTKAEFAMITRVQVKNYRSLADVDVTLGPLNVLVGRNGAGKSAFIDAIFFVRDALTIGLQTAVSKRHGFASLLNATGLNNSDEFEITLTVESHHHRTEYSICVKHSDQDGVQVERESFQSHNKSQAAEEAPTEEFEVENGLWKKRVYGRSEWEAAGPVEIGSRAHNYPGLLLPNVLFCFYTADLLVEELVRASFYAFYPDTLRQPQEPSDKKSFESHGENLASFLMHMKNVSGWFPDLLWALNYIVGDVSDIRVNAVGKHYLATELLHKMQDGREIWLELFQESDGTLSALGVLTALYQDSSRTLIAIEEPETNLHPGALAALSEVIQEAALRNQIIVTTQSPDLIARFGAETLRIVERNNGVTQIGPLEERQRQAINEQLFTSGDLLRIEGLRPRKVKTPEGQVA